MSDIDSLNSG